MRMLLFLGLFATLTSALGAECDADMLKAAREATLGELAASARFSSCEVLPNDQATIATLFAFERQSDDAAVVYDVHLTLLDKSSKRVIARRVELGAWPSDAYKIGSVTISSLELPSSSKARSFGVIESWGGSSSVAFYSIQVLSVYQQRGRKLVLVLDGLVTSIFQGEGCDVRITRELVFGPPSKRSVLVPITVRERMEGESRDHQSSCPPVNERGATYVLMAEHGVYRVPRRLQPFGETQ